MALIQRMIFWRAAVRTSLIFALFGCLAVTTQVLTHIFEIVDSPFGILLAIWLSVLLIPTIAVIILPMAVLIAAVQTFDALDESMEHAAARAAGATPMFLMAPVIWLGGGLSVLVLAISLWIEPAANRAVRDALAFLRTDALASFATDGVLRQVGHQIFIYAGNRDADGWINGLVVLDRRNPPADILYVAQSARLVRQGSQTRIEMLNGTIELQSGAEHSRFVITFGRFQPDAAEFFSDTPVRPGARETSTAALWLEAQAEAPSAPDALKELSRRGTDWLYGLALLGLGVWLAQCPMARNHRRAGVARLLPALAIGIVLRLAGLSLHPQTAQGGLALVASFVLPLTATAGFAALAVCGVCPTWQVRRFDHRPAHASARSKAAE